MSKQEHLTLLIANDPDDADQETLVQAPVHEHLHRDGQTSESAVREPSSGAHSTVTRSFGNDVSTSTPSSVTTTRSSILIPPRPLR